MGVFFIAIGIFLIMLFVFSDIVHAPLCGMLAWGGGLAAAGSLLIWLNPKPEPPESGRFRMLKNKNKKQTKKAR